MGDSNYLFPVALKWEEGPEKLKQLRNKLLLYFQSKNKSNGGECEIRDMESSQGYVLIHFREETVRDRVLQKTSHELKLPNGKQLSLNVRLPETKKSPDRSQDSAADYKAAQSPGDPATKKPALIEDKTHDEEKTHDEDVTQGPPSNLVLIENVQDTCSPEMLNLLVENISDKYEDIDFYVERIPEISSAVITFTCDIDTPSFITKFSSSPRPKQFKLTSKSLEETRSIRAEGLLPNTSEDHITLYFESPKHGGGSIEKTVMLPDQGAVIVTFDNSEVVKTVLTKQHEFAKKRISVYPYYPIIGECLYGKRGHCIATPDPVEFPINPYILEFISNDAEIKQNIEKQMADHTCEVTWPGPECPKPVIILSFPRTLSTHVRTMAKIAPAWRNRVHSMFSHVISKYKVTECNVDPSVWEAIKEKISSSSYIGIFFKTDFAGEKVFIVGITEHVTKIEPIFRKQVDEATYLMSRLEDAVPFELAFYKLVNLCGLVTSILDVSPNLKIEYDSTTEKVKLSGPKEEVLNAKHKILNTKEGLKSKSVHLNPYIIRFLMSVDNEEMSSILLRKNDIKAVFEVKEKAVLLTGYSEKDLTNAEEHIQKELICQRISVEDKSVTQTPEWRSLQTFLRETVNAENMRVLIEEFPVGAENEVVITGLSSPVQDTDQQIQWFLEKNTPIQKDIQIKSLAVMKFIEEEKKQLRDGWIKNNVRMLKKQNVLSLSGPKQYAEEAETCIKNILSMLHSDTLYIDKPGAKKFCINNEDMYINTARKKFNCVIYLQKDGDPRLTALETNLCEPHYQVTLQDGILVAVYKHDLSRHNVNVILNAADEDLKPNGEPALALLNAAGPELQTACDSIIKEEGRLTAGESVITDPGNLPCKQVIHTVGPKWDNKSDSKYERLLRKAITCSLHLAAENGHNSIAISAASFTISGSPVDMCAENIVKSIKQYVEDQHGTSSIRNIHLVDNDEDTVKAFIKSLNDVFEGDNVQFSPKHEVKKVKAKKKEKKVKPMNKVNGQMVTTKEGLSINILQGNIQDVTTNVIVNSVGKDLDLSFGAVSKAIFKKAGNKLQDLLNKESQDTWVDDGSLFITEGCNLSCDIVIHSVVPQWNGGKNYSEEILKKIVNTCLSTTEEKQLRSLTFPAIGTGILGFPKNTVAALMFEEILNFSSKIKVQYLKEVIFMLHPSDTETIQAFSTELDKKINTSSQKKTGKSQPFCGSVKTPTLGVHEMKIGSITYQVKTGDITKEDTDVIVNSTDQTFTLQSGVSNPILEAAGQSVQDEYAQLGSQGNTSHIITKNGNLLCKQILHIAGKNSPNGIKGIVSEALHVCAKLQASSVAFPGIGTGVGSVPPAVVADIILETVVDFAKSKSSQCIQTVKVVIFQQQMLYCFYSSMKKKEGTVLPKQTSYLSNIATSVINYLISYPEEEEEETNTFELRENIEPAVFHLCAESAEAVRGATSWLQDLILMEQNENIITDDWIRDFDDKEHQTLAQLQKKLEVTVSFESPGSTIKISGLTRDVLEMTNKIQDMIKSVRDKKTREREAELCSNLVEWRYNDGTKSEPFDKMTNMELEKAKNEGSQSFTIDIKGVSYTVVMERKSARDPRGNTLILERVPKYGQLDLPTQWAAMTNENVKVVPLNPGSPEYTGVQAQFKKTCLMRIIKIDRIQNRHLWINYQIKKQSIDSKNKTTNNELQLFHGTDASTVSTVNHNGFNRSYAGKNMAVYGNGTYFAVGSNYSADDTYSKPDKNAQKYMYLARVLTGMSCAGKQGMVAPPAKNPANPTDLYDSVTDNTTTPSMYVIFHDIQAYPEYLITFSK